MNMVTWNMQGAGGGGGKYGKGNLWTNNVFFDRLDTAVPGAPQIVEDADIICLQECGMVPEHYVPEADPWAPPPVQCFVLRRGTRSRGADYYLSYYQWDEGAHRVNLGTITRERPVWAFLSAGARWRPLLCVVPAGPRLSPVLIANIHAGQGGFDVNELLQEAAEIGARYQCVYVLGDFNRDANSRDFTRWPLLPYEYYPIYPPGPTQRSGGTLDYMVEKGRMPGTIFCQVLSSHGLSDHSPVLFTM
jgi:hypothetical protein